MSRGYTTSTLLCFCALSFIFGRFVQEIPGLPQTKSGVRSCHFCLAKILQIVLWCHRKGRDDHPFLLITCMGLLQFTQSGGAASKSSRRQAIEKPVQQAQIPQSRKPQVYRLLPLLASQHPLRHDCKTPLPMHIHLSYPSRCYISRTAARLRQSSCFHVG